MKIELNDGASDALQALFWAAAIATILGCFANCTAREAEAQAARPVYKVEGNTVLTIK
jgi:hypothetical protein